ncbi:hypothetical protein [Halobacteriovorax sp. HLS]|uniref:hypothetical protein n=1 Tax=Halobacteriovorax sp. HLS TaxID=2234000 RepID=UPI000FD7EB42|nr:hypothetical protein [Halobacteriovorax sp. HLS]
MDKFEKYCVDQNDEIRLDVFVKDEMYSCKTEFEYIQKEFEARESLMSQHPEIYEQYQNCIKNKDASKVSDFAESVEDIAEKVSCLAEEKKDFEKDCSKAWQCNKFRAVLDVIEVLPGPIERPVERYIQSEARQKGLSSDCLSDDKSNCMEDFVNALMDNLWSSATSILNLAKSGFKSLFNMDKFFSDEADKQKVKMNQTVEDVETFLDSPGKWISNFLDKLKSGVDKWVRSSVFCQEWEYNSDIRERGGVVDSSSGALRTCTKPLDNYDCIDCDDKINATCIALGGLTAELGVAFFTAGIGTAANFAARAGAKSLAIVSAKVGTKIKAVAPSFSKGSKAKVAQTSRAAALMSKGISKSTEMAKLMYSVSSAKAKKFKARADALSLAVKNTKVVKVTALVIEKGNVPARISEKIGEKGALLAAKVTSKVGKGTVKKEADLLLKASKKSKTSSKAKDFVDERTHGKKRVVGHTAKGKKHYDRGEKATSGGETLGSSNSHSDHGAHSNNKSSDSSGRGSRERVSREKPRKDDNLTREKTERERVTLDKKKSEDAKSLTEKKNREDERVAIEKKKKEDERIAAEKKKKEEHHEEENDKKNGKTSIVKVAASVVAVDLAAKGVNISREEAQQEIERLKEKRLRKNDKFSNNLNSAKEVLGIDDKTSSPTDITRKADALTKMYSNANKETIVSSIQKANPNMSRRDAENAFSQRRNNVIKARDYINTEAAVESTSVAKREKVDKLRNQLEQIKTQGKISSLNTEIEDLKKQSLKINEDVQSEIGDTREVVANRAATPSSSTRAPIESSRTSLAAPSSGRAVSSAASANTSSASASSSSESIGSEHSGENSTHESNHQGSVAVDSLEGAENLNEIDSLHDATDELVVESDLTELKVEDESVARKKSSNLKNLLNLISKNKMKIEKNVTLDLDVSKVKAQSEQIKSKLIKLKLLSIKKSLAQKKVTYTTGKGRLEVYHFDDEVFPIVVSEKGELELLNNTESQVIIQSSIDTIE